MPQGPMPPVRLVDVADSTGYAIVVQQDLGSDLMIGQISVETTGVEGTCVVRLNGAFLCGSAQGWLDVADGDPAALVQRGDRLTVEWFDAGAGVECRAMMLGDQL